MARRIRVRKEFHGGGLMEADESLESSAWNAKRARTTRFRDFPRGRRGSGQSWIRTSEGVSQRIYSPPRLATSVSTQEKKGGVLYARARGAASD